MRQKLIIGLFCLLAVFIYRILPSNDLGNEMAVAEGNVEKSIEPVEHKPKHASEKVNKVLSTAREFIGTPHAYGQQSKSGIDCSGLVNLAFQSIGVKIPRSSSDMANIGDQVKVKELQVGDIVLFTHPGGTSITHSGIVTKFEDVGTIEFIHTSSSKGVIEESMTSDYWATNFVTARRIL